MRRPIFLIWCAVPLCIFALPNQRKQAALGSQDSSEPRVVLFGQSGTYLLENCNNRLEAFVGKTLPAEDIAKVGARTPLAVGMLSA